jgi:CheY-specific phosphatase CheX
MEKFIIQAVDNFFRDNLNFDTTVKDSIELRSSYVSKISLGYEDKDEVFYLILDSELSKEIASTMLFDEEPDDETIKDLVNETANLIIGNLKMIICEAKGLDDIELSTPKYLGCFEYALKKEFMNSYRFLVNNHPLMIGQMSKVIA